MAGSTLTGEMDGFDASPIHGDIDDPPDGWVMKTLFRDWGDTVQATGDGGFETGAIVVKNLEGGGTSQPFDSMLAARYANTAAMASYAFTQLANGTGRYSCGKHFGRNNYRRHGAVQAANMVFDNPGSLVPAQDQDLGIDRMARRSQALTSVLGRVPVLCSMTGHDWAVPLCGTPTGR